jgi:hypothetical protein
MSTCPNRPDLFERILAGEAVEHLSPEDAEHLRSCPVCRQNRQRLQKLESNLSEFAAAIKPSLSGPDAPWAAPAPFFPNRILITLMAVAGALVAFLWLTDFLRREAVQETVSPPPAAHRMIVETPDGLVIAGRLFSPQGELIDHPGTLLNSGRIAETREPMDLTLAGGVTVSLEEKARFRFYRSEVALESGKIKVLVPRPGTPFSVSTPVAVLGVRGTRFEVEVTPAATQVRLESGVLQVRTVSGLETRLSTPPQSLTILADGTLSHTGSSPGPTEPEPAPNPAPPSAVPTETPPPPEEILNE